ncbi:MAG TPA: hypothetical protein DCL44_12340, partial [Elusimicrobia bacterium]|nr:hypothetical protein [Elusimicrobiota bacterium]
MPKSILIIDDNEEIASLLRDHLLTMGFSVSVAIDGNSGVEKALKLTPDIITMDFNMPGANGVEVYKELRKHPETAAIPVIFFSSIVTGLIRRMVPENPRVRFLKKPCNIAEIEKNITEMAALPKQAPPASSPDNSQDPPPPKKK